MSQLRVRDLTPAFGAQVEGLDPSRPLDEESSRLLRDTFDRRGLLLLRDIDLDEDFQGCLASTLIGVDEAEERALMAGRGPIFVSNKEPEGYAPFGRLLFHSDMMWFEAPFQVLSLYGVHVAPPAVPTVFTSTKHAWDTLPADLRARVEGLHVVHMTGQQRRDPEDDGDLLEPIREHQAMTTTSVGHRHPRTGETILYISQMNTSEIVELSHDESEALLRELFDHLYRPEHLYEHDWRERDLVAWDNIAIQHARGTVQKEGPERTLRKVIRPFPRAKIEAPRFSEAR